MEWKGKANYTQVNMTKELLRLIGVDVVFRLMEAMFIEHQLSLLEYARIETQGSICSIEEDCSINMALALTILYLQHLFGADSTLLPSVVSAISLLLYNDAHKAPDVLKVLINALPELSVTVDSSNITILHSCNAGPY